MAVEVNPATGVTTGTTDVTFKGVGAGATTIGVLIDQGLSISDVVSSGGHAVSFDQQPYSPYAYTQVTLTPKVAAGEQVTVSLKYSGTLACVVDPAYARPSRTCGTGGDMNFFMRGSLFPDVMDPNANWATDGFSVDLVLSVPTGQQVVFSGDLQNSKDDGTTLQTTWKAANFTTMMTQLAVTGDLAKSESAGTTPPTTVYSLKSSPKWNTEMADWMKTILPFIDAQSGAKLPFTQLSVIKLPELYGFDGTATNAVTFLGEQYGDRGNEMFEETLAHENVHLWWGVMVYPAEPSLWLVEGLAMITEYDYAASRFHASENRDLYLATRYRENELGLRYLTDPKTLPPLMLASWAEMPSVMMDSTVWAYIKSSATLDYLRLVLGEDSFAKGLQDYRAKCAFAACTTLDFQQAMQTASGQDLQTFLDQFVYATRYPALVVAFDQIVSGVASKVTVKFDQSADITTPMQLWFVLDDGTIKKQVVEANGLSSSVTADLPSRVRAVMPNPRQDAILWSRSAQTGDVDMDGEVDGRDVIHCARLVGKTPKGKVSPNSILGSDMEFDPRCDLVVNEAIDDADLVTINNSFATVKAP
jgi:hypothetical protein